MSTQLIKADPLGLHRVVEPAGASPQAAWKLDNSAVAFENEILCEVELLNLDSTSMAQLRQAHNDDADAVAGAIMRTVRERGKQHNPVTESGGMFAGVVREIGSLSPFRNEIKPGDRIASLVSLTLTPLALEAIDQVDLLTGQVAVRGHAVLFASGKLAKLPDDVPERVALAVLDVAGAPAQMHRMVRSGMTVAVIGADGKSGLLSCAQAKARTGDTGTVIAIVPDADSEGSRVLRKAALADRIVAADARNARVTSDAFSTAAPQLADLVVNCVNVPGTETASILCARDGGTVYFFSMCTSFSAAALGAEGVGKDVQMIIGNGYAPRHAEIALQTLRDNPILLGYFTKRYGTA